MYVLCMLSMAGVVLVKGAGSWPIPPARHRPNGDGGNGPLASMSDDGFRALG